jgi:AI-2E family transporter
MEFARRVLLVVLVVALALTVWKVSDCSASRPASFCCWPPECIWRWNGTVTAAACWRWRRVRHHHWWRQVPVAAIALRPWFGGQLIAMLLVGGRTAAGLWLIGVPAFLGLDLIAGLTELIPILGPIAGAVPALMVASAQDWVTVAWVLALFVFIQQVENFSSSRWRIT